MAQRTVSNGPLSQIADGDIAWTIAGDFMTAFWEVLSPPASTGEASHTLRVPFHFGGSIPPPESVIDGFLLTLRWFKSGIRELLDQSIRLRSASIGVWSAERAAGVNIPPPTPPSLTVDVLYGGASDLFGEAPDPSDVHDSMEARLKLEIDSGVGNATCELVAALLTVYYTPSAEWVATRTCYDVPQIRAPQRRKTVSF